MYQEILHPSLFPEVYAGDLSNRFQGQSAVRFAGRILDVLFRDESEKFRVLHGAVFEDFQQMPDLFYVGAGRTGFFQILDQEPQIVQRILELMSFSPASIDFLGHSHYRLLFFTER
jgi:hypothetical protein